MFHTLLVGRLSWRLGERWPLNQASTESDEIGIMDGMIERPSPPRVETLRSAHQLFA